MPRNDDKARAAAEAVARASYGKLVAYLAARTRDVAGAEDALFAEPASLACAPLAEVPIPQRLARMRSPNTFESLWVH